MIFAARNRPGKRLEKNVEVRIETAKKNNFTGC